MAITLTGLKSDAPYGEYLELSVWTWSFLQSVAYTHFKELINKDTWEQMIGNDQAGADDGETCIEMADRIDGWLDCEECVDDAIVKPEMKIDRETVSAKTKEWTAFLRHCGGFAVC
jgi:hypothetical protein